MGALTKLAAVNRILRAADEHPVSSLSSPSGDSLMAEQLLEEATLEIQVEGDNINIESVKVLPDGDGFINLSDNTLHVEGDGRDARRHLTQRGSSPTRLYDKDNSTFVFEAGKEVHLRVHMMIDFEDLPTATQLFAADTAARRYQMQVQSDAQVDRSLEQREAISRMKSRANNIRANSANSFNKWGNHRPFDMVFRVLRRRF
jgi:hypothetical protein